MFERIRNFFKRPAIYWEPHHSDHFQEHLPKVAVGDRIEQEFKGLLAEEELR